MGFAGTAGFARSAGSAAGIQTAAAGWADAGGTATMVVVVAGGPFPHHEVADIVGAGGAVENILQRLEPKEKKKELDHLHAGLGLLHQQEPTAHFEESPMLHHFAYDW